MDNKLDTLTREQLVQIIDSVETEMGEAYQEISNTADLWSCGTNEQQELCCRSLACGLDIGKQMLQRAIKAQTSNDNADRE